MKFCKDMDDYDPAKDAEIEEAQEKENQQFYRDLKAALRKNRIPYEEKLCGALVKSLHISCVEKNKDYDMQIDMILDNLYVVCRYPFRFESSALAAAALYICEKADFVLDLYYGTISYTRRIPYATDIGADLILRDLDLIHTEVMGMYDSFLRISKFSLPPEEQKDLYRELLEEGLNRMSDHYVPPDEIRLGTAHLQENPYAGMEYEEDDLYEDLPDEKSEKKDLFSWLKNGGIL